MRLFDGTLRSAFAIAVCVTVWCPCVRADSAADLSDLGSAEYSVRQSATRRMLADESLTREALRELYSRATSAEQRQRLLSIAHHVVVRDELAKRVQPGDKGAVGIVPIGLSKEELPELGRAAVGVASVFEGFPAYESLEVGDILLGANGKALGNNDNALLIQQEFVELIQDTPAGGKVIFQTLRDGKVRNITVRLAPLLSLQLYSNDQALRQAINKSWDDFREGLGHDATAGGQGPELTLPPVQENIPQENNLQENPPAE
ncbi:MAG: hypothetical protein GC164_15705 [Phycisphaera sp.]|nr:hypothetical protein [Phycisphaera sp.]